MHQLRVRSHRSWPPSKGIPAGPTQRDPSQGSIGKATDGTDALAQTTSCSIPAPFFLSFSLLASFLPFLVGRVCFAGVPSRACRKLLQRTRVGHGARRVQDVSLPDHTPGRRRRCRLATLSIVHHASQLGVHSPAAITRQSLKGGQEGPQSRQTGDYRARRQRPE